MSEYKFTVGEYVTRDGRKAVVLIDSAPGACPLVGYILLDGPPNKKMKHTPRCWDAQGRGLPSIKTPQDWDLMPSIEDRYAAGWDAALEAAARDLATEGYVPDAAAYRVIRDLKGKANA